MSNILVIMGSPRRKGNSDLLADSFIKGATDSGHQAVKFETAFANILGCCACDTCWSKGKPCSFADDFNQIFIPLVNEADGIVFSFPLYFYGFPSGMWAFIEKTYSLLGENSPTKMKITKSAMIVCGGEKDFEAYTGVMGTYNQLCRGLHWTNKGIIVAKGILQKGEVTHTDFLKQAEDLGKIF